MKVVCGRLVYTAFTH
ncbi:hypothetical protein K6U30_00125 [Vibrio furnissii]|nr:hypothetical protein [Vibrio furnissii]